MTKLYKVVISCNKCKLGNILLKSCNRLYPQNMDMWTMRSAHLKVRLIRVRSKENNEGEEEEAATLKLITDAVVCTLGHLLTEVGFYPLSVKSRSKGNRTCRIAIFSFSATNRNF